MSSALLDNLANVDAGGCPAPFIGESLYPFEGGCKYQSHPNIRLDAQLTPPRSLRREKLRSKPFSRFRLRQRLTMLHTVPSIRLGLR